MQLKPIPFLLGCCLCLLLACGSATSAAVPSSDSIWQFMSSRPDLSIMTYLVSQFPDILLRLSDPELSITMFLPTDKAMQQCRYVAPGQQCPAPLRQVLKHRMDLMDLMAPGLDVDESASSNRRYRWQVLMYMALETPKALTLKALKNDTGYATAGNAVAGGSGGIDPSTLYVYKNTSGTFLASDYGPDYGLVRVHKGDLRAGKSIVHLVDGDIFPGIPPLDSYFSVYEGVSSTSYIFTQVLTAVKDALDMDLYPLPLTIFAPSDAAMQRWLNASHSSVDQLLSNSSLCLQLVQAHCAPSKPLTWAALLTPDLVALAAAGNESIMRHPMSIRNLRGHLMQLKTKYTGLSAGPLSVSFAEPNSTKTSWGVVLPPIDFGGQEVSFGDAGGVVHVFHVVSAVLMA